MISGLTVAVDPLQQFRTTNIETVAISSSMTRSGKPESIVREVDMCFAAKACNKFAKVNSFDVQEGNEEAARKLNLALRLAPLGNVIHRVM